MPWFGSSNDIQSYRERDLKAHLKACLIRLNLRKNKALGAVQKNRREIAAFLKGGDDEKARIITEQALKEENNVRAFQELQAICEEITARLGMISASKRLPMDLKESICTCIWVSARLDVKEFGLIRQQLALRYGANLDHEALCNIDHCVSSLMIELLSPDPPPVETVTDYVKGVAKEFQVPWHGLDEPSAEVEDEDDDDAIALDDIYGVRSSGSGVNLTKKTLTSLTDLDGDDDTGDLDEFEKMFVSVPRAPQSSAPSTPELQSQPPASSPSIVQQVRGPTVQRVVSRVAPSSVSTTSHLDAPTPQKISLSKGSPPRADPRMMTKDLAEMSSQDLEAEFEKLFNSTMGGDTLEPTRLSPLPSHEPTPTTSGISLKKAPQEPPKQQYAQEHVATGGSSEYDDLFSAPADANPPTNAPETDEYDDMFARLSSVTASTSTNQQEPSKDDELDDQALAEWEARFNVGGSFGTSSPSADTPNTTSQAPSQGGTDDDDLMRRFLAL